MSLKQVRIFPISSYDSTTGAPVLGTAVKLYDESNEVNNISVELVPDSSTREYNADNTREEETVVKGLNGTLTYYGITAEALATILPYEKDTNGNLNLVINASNTKNVAIFFRGKNEKGTEYTCWLYCCKFSANTILAGQETDSPTESTITFYAQALTITKNSTTHSSVGTIAYKGNTGYVADGTEPTASDLYVM